MGASRQGGQALLVVVIFSLILGMVSASLVVMSVANSTASQNGVKRAIALSVAEIGVERAKAKISTGTFEQQFATQNHQAVDAEDVHPPEGGLYGSYALRVVEEHGGVEGQYLVISQGTIGQSTRQISVVLRGISPDLPDLLAAITLYNPNALAVFHGVPPNVCGMDTDLPMGMPFSSVRASDCVPGSGEGPHAVGIGVHDDQSVADIIGALGNNTYRVTGVGDNGTIEDASVYNVTGNNPTGRIDTLTAGDIGELATQLEGMADYVYDSHCWFNAHGKTVSDGNFGTTTQPRIVVLRDPSEAKVHLAGNITGVGILIIDSEVEFTGTFNYAGVIIITHRGNATVSLDMMGTPLVMGAILAANPSEDATSVLDLRGTADVFYSSQAMAYAQEALDNRARFETVFYTENKPNAADLEIEIPW